MGRQFASVPMMSLWDCPECIGRAVLELWLPLRDIGLLDTAVCRKKHRRHFLNVMAMLRFPRKKCFPMEITFCYWSLLRGVSLERIYMPPELAESPGFSAALLRFNGNCLVELHIPGDYEETTTIMTVAKHCIAVRRLLLDNLNLDEPSFIALLDMPALLELCLCDLTVSGSGESLCRLPMPTKLWSLQLVNAVFSERFLFRLLGLCPNLAELYFYNETRLSGDCMAAVIRATPSSASYSLNEFAQLNRNCMEAIAERGNALKSLLLCGTAGVTDADMDIVLRSCRSLLGLNLTGCGLITASTVFTIAQHCPLMRDLSLDGTELTDAALIALVKGCPQLWRIFLPRCDGLTDVGIEYLGRHARALRKLQLYWHPPAITARHFGLFRKLDWFRPVDYVKET